jgi:hypothetical protein
MREIKVSVTAEDIREGTPGDYTSCPVALALRRALGDVSEIEVDNVEAEIFLTNGDSLSLRLPPDAGRFINEFDCQRPVEPFEFELELYDD